MTNYFRELHPISTGVYFLGMLILIMMASYNKSMVILFLALSVHVIYTEGIRAFAKELRTYLVMILGFGIFNLIFYHQERLRFFMSMMCRLQWNPWNMESAWDLWLYHFCYGTGCLMPCLIIRRLSG